MQYYYWELLDMVRKLFLTAVLINFTNSTSTAYVLVHIDARACMHTQIIMRTDPY